MPIGGYKIQNIAKIIMILKTKKNKQQIILLSLWNYVKVTLEYNFSSLYATI